MGVRQEPQVHEAMTAQSVTKVPALLRRRNLPHRQCPVCPYCTGRHMFGLGKMHARFGIAPGQLEVDGSAVDCRGTAMQLEQVPTLQGQKFRCPLLTARGRPCSCFCLAGVLRFSCCFLAVRR